MADDQDGAGRHAPRKPAGDAFARERLDWLEVVAAEATLPVTAYRLATIVALRYLNRSRGFAWPSLATLSADLGVGKKAILRAVEALESHGLLSVVRSRGRGHANEYRIETPAQKGIRADTVSDDEKGIRADTVSGGKGIRSIPEKVSGRIPHPLDEPIDCAGAHSARPAHEPNEFIEDGEVGRAEQGRALDRAPLFPFPASDLHHHAPHDKDLGKTVTLADLDTLAAEEWAAANTPHALAAAALADLHGERLLDPRAFVADLIDGFIEGDADAAAHIAELIAYDLLEARGEARALWAAQRAIAGELFHAISPDRAEDALAGLHGAVREAGEAEKASRKAAVEHEEAETKSAAMKGSAHA